jgi:PRC-barrel domain
MFQNSKELFGKKLTALDGDIGHVKDFYFDDAAWAIRYVVVDTGTWLTGRLVLLSPRAFPSLDHEQDTLRVELRKKQIQDSPSIASHETVSEQFEEQYYRSYGWPVYWQGGEMWGMSGDPLVLAPQPRDVAVRKALEPAADRHLQSAKTVAAYHIEAVDGTIGHLSSFNFDAKSWAIRELVVETGHWYSEKHILVSASSIERISFLEKKIFIKLTKAEIQSAAEHGLAGVGAGVHGVD